MDHQRNKQTISSKPFLKIISNESFVGRQKYLEILDTYVKTRKTNILIRGPRGVGKTELAKEFAVKLQNSTNISCSILNGESEDDFKNSAIDQLQKIVCSPILKLKQMQTLDVFKRILELLPKNSLAIKWLVIIDNLTCKKVETSILKPILKHFRNEEQTNSFICIITASNLNVNIFTDIVKLDQFRLQESLELFRNHKIGNPSNPSSGSQNDRIDYLTKLADKLGNFPLAIKQAISYIKSKQTWEELYCASDLLIELKKNPKIILDHKPDQFELEIDSTIYQAIVSTVDNFNKPSKNLLIFLSYVNSTISEESLIKLGASIPFEDFPESYKMLKTHFLVEIENCTITIHPMIQLVVRLNFSENQEEFLLQFIKNTKIESLDRITLRHYMTLMCHAIHLYNKLEMTGENTLPILLLKKLVDINLYEEANVYYKKLFLKNTNWVFKTDIAEINLLRQQIEIELKILNLKVVEKSLLNMLPVIEKNLIATCYKTLGKCLYYQDKFDEAENYYKKSFENLQSNNLNRESVQLQVNIANCLKRQEKFSEANVISKKMLSWQEEQVKLNIIPTKDALRTRHSIAHCLQAHSKKVNGKKSVKMLKDAKKIFEKVLEEGTKIYGKDYPQFFSTMFMIAKVSNELGESSEEILNLLNTLLGYQTKIKTREAGEILKTEQLITEVKRDMEKNGKLESTNSHKKLKGDDSELFSVSQNIDYTPIQSSSERTASNQKPCEAIRNEIQKLRTIFSGILESIEEIKEKTNQTEKEAKDAIKSFEIIDSLIDKN